MSALTLAYVRWRWLQLPAAVLIVLLQRFPMLRAAIAWEPAVSARTVVLLQGALLGVWTADEVHAQTGATRLSPSPGEEGNPGQGTVGVPFEGAVAIVGAPLTAASYRVTGTLPPGLEIPGITRETFNGLAVPITGTPTQAGTFQIFLQAWNMENLQGEGGQTFFDYSIVIEESDEPAVQLTLDSSPSSVDLDPGETATFATTATANEAISYQWFRYRSGETSPQALPGETAATFSINNVSVGDMGFYFVRLSSGHPDLHRRDQSLGEFDDAGEYSGGREIDARFCAAGHRRKISRGAGGGTAVGGV